MVAPVLFCPPQRWNPEEIQELAPLETALAAEEGAQGETVPVRLHSNVNEVGTLEFWCQSTRDPGAGSSNSASANPPRILQFYHSLWDNRHFVQAVLAQLHLVADGRKLVCLRQPSDFGRAADRSLFDYSSGLIILA